MKRKVRIFFIAALFSLFFILAISTQVEPAKALPAEISVEPSYQRIVAGEAFTINITVDPKGNEVMGVSYKLYFNNTVLNATLQEKGPFLSQDSVPTDVMENIIDNNTGVVSYAEYRKYVDYGVSNPGIAATITFVAKAEGMSLLNLTEHTGAILADPYAHPIPTTIVGGWVDIMNVTPSPIRVAGYVFYENGSECFNPSVNITNENLSRTWNASVSGNYYQYNLTYPFEVRGSDVLRFDAISPDRLYLNSSNHTVTAAEIQSGSILFNITLQKRTIRDVEVERDYYPEGNGIKIKDGAGNTVTGRLESDTEYYVFYKVRNRGEQDELVNVSVSISNATPAWHLDIATHEWYLPLDFPYRESPGDCLNTSGLAPGYYNLTVAATIRDDHNPDFYPDNNERIRVIPLEVSPIYKSDLIITEAWVCWPDNCTICYNITNIGEGTASAGHNTILYIDGAERAYDEVPVSLTPGGSYIGCFSDYTWTYTPPKDDIMVCADHNEALEESDEENNCLSTTWKCGDVDSNGYITTWDVGLLNARRWDTSFVIFEWAGDVDGNGYITTWDVGLLNARRWDPDFTLSCMCQIET